MTASAASTLVGALAGAPRDIPGRPGQRPSRFADAGMTLLRTDGTQAPEIWCRCDGGPHGFLSIAAHAHADALSVEVRYGGVDVLADPGTYCYHGEPAWRSYFRSTIAHNTVELDGRNQSAEGGPFLWLRHANGHEIDVADTGETAEWTAEHDGYLSLRPPARHRRSVRLDRAARSITHRRRDRRRRLRRPARLPPRPRGRGGARRQRRGAALAHGGHAGGGAAGTAAAAAVEPAPRRDRSDPRLVLARSGPAGARVHAARPRARHAIRVFCHPDGVRRTR